MKINPKIPPAELAVGWLTMFLMGTELFVFSPLLPILAVNYDVSSNMAGLCVTIFSLAYMITAPLFGHVSDRVGKRQVLICCLLAFATANLLTASAVNFPWLLALRLFAGAAAAGVAPSIYALVGDAAPPDRRATWLALTVSGLLVSLALGASPAGLVGATFGWAAVFVALAVFSLALVALNCWVWPRDCQGGPAGPLGNRLAVASLTRRLMPMIVWGTGLYGVYTYLGAGLAAFGFSKLQVARAVMVYGCGAIAGTLIGGRLADRLGAKCTAGLSLLGLCICFFLLLLAFRAGVLVVDLALGLSATVAQLFFPAQQSGLANDFPARRSAVLAWNNSALFLGISLGSLIGGEAVAIGGFDMVLIICAGILFAGCIVNWIVVPGPTRLQIHRPGNPT
jgi:predicted MFS family arabinose efflux permease